MELSDIEITVHEEERGRDGHSPSADGYNSTGDAESQKYILREQEVEVRSERRLT